LREQQGGIALENTETKVQRIERLKREKNPWECLDEIRSFAKNGIDSIPPEWLGTYFRFWGVYTQGDGNGVTGGARGEGKALPYFMVRIRIPNGLLLAHQVKAIADLTERYARGSADITVRQNIQLHWIAIEDLPTVLETLWQCGLTTMGSCGDDTRNIVGCPLSGIDADELYDASPLLLQANQQFVGNAEFYNLPRKFKICVTGCPVWCSYPEINDVGLTAVRRAGKHGDEVGFSLRVAGGLSTDPHLARRLDAFVLPHQVLPVLKGIAGMFRDSDVLRECRERARLKFLFLKHGWSEDSFLEELLRRVGFELAPAAPELPPDDVYRDHVGVHEQKQQGYYFVGASVLRGRISSAQLRIAADAAERYAGGELRTTNMQNLLIVNVPRKNVAALADTLTLAGLAIDGSPFARGVVACSGTEFCKLAITETKSYARWLVEQLDERLPGFEQDLRLNITGCPNSCGQHWIADLGLEGKKIRRDDQLIDAYYFCVGGGVGRHQSIARPVGFRCAADEVPDAIERLLVRFRVTRESGENLRQFFARHSVEEIRTFLAGTEFVAVERDPSPGRVPHGVEG
jgi:sulfite reductase (ferredoxin)